MGSTLSVNDYFAEPISLLLIENDQVDEMAFVRNIAENKLPYLVKVAHSVSEARQILANNNFDIIVADYNLSDGTALDMREEFVDQTVILITGVGTEEIAARAFKIVSDYLIKDSDYGYLKLLPGRINAVLQQKRTAEQLKERLKEMTCLYEIRHYLDLKLSIADVCKKTIECLIPAMQFPNLMVVDIEINGQQFSSLDSHLTYSTPKLQSEISVKGVVCGKLSVCYSQKKSFIYPEEQTLIRAVANDLGLWLERKEYDQDLRIAAVALESSDGIMITNAEGVIVKINSAFTKITKYKSEEVIGKLPSILQLECQNEQFFQDMWGTLDEKNDWHGEVDFKHKDGSVYPVQLSISAVKNIIDETTQYVSIFQDISARKSAENKIYNLSFYDELTSLPNRRLLIDQHLKSAIVMSKSTGYYGALLFLDIDKFKSINDVFGRDHGDKFLIEIANRLTICTRDTDIVARFGGDEFMVMLTNLNKDVEVASQNARDFAEKIRNKLIEPYFIDRHEYYTSPSIGIITFCGDDSADTLIKHVDAAMYQAKDRGRNRVHFFDSSVQMEIDERAKIESELHCALVDKQLQLYYQIQVDSNNKTTGVEALIRWDHPRHGMFSPLKFIPIAEESSLIMELGQWILDVVCAQLVLWCKNTKTNKLSIAINISSRQFHDKNFVKTVAAAIQSYGIEPSLLKLELTESVVLDDTHALEQIALLRTLGVQLSLDDFGTGYSSLTYLKKLQIDQLKIDQSFVRDIYQDVSGEIMVKTIIDLADNFKLDIIAEGVETESQLAFLKENGCNMFQGYLFSRPLPIEEIDDLLNKYPMRVC